METLNNNNNLTVQLTDVEVAYQESAELQAKWQELGERRKKLAEERAERDAANKQTFGDFYEILTFLRRELSLRIGGIGEDDDRVNQKREAQICMAFSDVLLKSEQRVFLYENEVRFRHYGNNRWQRATIEDLMFLALKGLEGCGAGDVYLVNSPKKIATFVFTNARNCPQNRYAPDVRYLGMRNGILDLDRRELLPHNPNLTPKFHIDLLYAPDARNGLFEKFLDEVLSKEKQAVVAEAFGNLLAANEEQEKIVVFIGNGSNGKSTLVEAAKAAIGRDNFSCAKLCDVVGDGGLSIYNMSGRLANFSSEGNTLSLGDEDKLKAYASGEEMRAKCLYHQPFDTTDYPKTIGMANNLPATGDFSDGFYRRFLIVPFSAKISQADTTLKAKLRAGEVRQAFFAWMLAGYYRLKEQGGFSQCGEVDRVWLQYRTESDSVLGFLTEFGYEPTEEGSPQRMPFKTLFADYDRWRIECHLKDMTSRTFASRLRSLGYPITKSNGWQWVHLAVKSQYQESTEAVPKYQSEIDYPQDMPF